MLNYLVDEVIQTYYKGKDERSFSEIINIITGGIYTADKVASIKEKLRNVKYFNLRNIYNYKFYIEKMVERVNLGGENLISENQKFYFFFGGLPREFQEKFLWYDLDEIEDATYAIAKLETIYKQKIGKNNSKFENNNKAFNSRDPKI
ncbi:hypothetical protein HERIO_1754 [Hepatospora eriocheir]|uniref:Uncharacterized protein n=1 Tax=Hepatospora eriocheir TaxID=1081669 RepID=A0A1X0Q972_9MICR|nr:hypothetical protein HERIO_1754 [Hepatospora eriocheir]